MIPQQLGRVVPFRRLAVRRVSPPVHHVSTPVCDLAVKLQRLADRHPGAISVIGDVVDRWLVSPRVPGR